MDEIDLRLQFIWYLLEEVLPSAPGELTRVEEDDRSNKGAVGGELLEYEIESVEILGQAHRADKGDDVRAIVP